MRREPMGREPVKGNFQRTSESDDRTFRFRSRLLRLGMTVALASLVLRLAYIQVAEANELSDMADNAIKAEKRVNGVRGTIYDKNNKKLAFTGVAYDVSIDIERFTWDDAAKNGDTPEEYARFLAPLLGATEDELLKYMKPEKEGVRAVYLGPKGQKVDSSVHDKVEEVQKQKKFRGINMIRTDIRQYPNNSFAASILGYYGYSDEKKMDMGRAGLEFTYDEVLRGKPGHVEYYTDKYGNPLPSFEPDVKVPAVDGEDIVLTIDENIQHFAEEELNNIVNKYGPKHASIIVADPNNGEILAMGSRPTFDPNHFAKAEQPEALWNNWALRSFEPGSTFKVFVLAAALAEHKLDLEEQFNSGSIQVGTDVIKDWNGVGWGPISYRQGVYHSSNVGFVKIGQKIGKESLYDYIYRFGFKGPTGIDLPNEGTSQLFTPSKMRESDMASTSFGQGISVTPIQQVAAMMAVANGGKVYQPHLVKEFRDPETGETLRQVKSKVLSEVGNEEVMSTVRDVLEETVLADENKTNYIKGYHVAGKTGTAQVPKDGGVGYEANNYRLSFIGFAPADKPRILVYVTVDQPSRNAPLQFGSIVAAPSAKIVMEQTLRYLQVPIDPNDGIAEGEKPGEAAKQPVIGKPAEPVTFVKVPDFIGATKEQVAQLSEQSGLKIDTVGEGPKVTGQWPDVSYGQVPQGTQIKLYFGPEGSKDGQVKVPDLRGLSMREAMETLSLLNLHMEPTGTGYVVKQATAPDTLVPFGTPIKLEFAPQS